ncbi:MAG: metalloregulator ArsR/SmtB family transcription factor [Candidatus ainarchaeum sp.]|nr:metalloregulator ArsR/SmtB family transcription factor [Candidatus ainarchaeum sp.]
MKKNKYYLFFRRFSDPLRMEIILLLKKKPMSVMKLSKHLKIEQSKLSHALAILKHCKIVYSEIKGKKRVYYLNKNIVLPLLKLVDKYEKKNCPICLAMKHCRKINRK